MEKMQSQAEMTWPHAPRGVSNKIVVHVLESWREREHGIGLQDAAHLM
jgi:hypothetical protein